MAESNSTKLVTIAKDETGHIYERLTVLGRADDPRPGAWWTCKCECGNVAVVAGGALRSGSTVSCGCKRRSQNGGYATTEYTSWKEMKRRCYNARYREYRYYGARGIFICDRWRHSFVNFLADMGPKPFPEATIDRIDNDGPYSPENCRWATKMEQSHNSRKARMLTHNGETLCLREWARRIGIAHCTLRQRLECGWSLEKALTTPAIEACRNARHRRNPL